MHDALALRSDDRLDRLAPSAALTGWLNANVPELGNGLLNRQLVSEGSTSILIALDRGGDMQAVLRRPYPDAGQDAAAAIGGEAQMLAALDGSTVPHPRLLGSCGDASVIGQPFLLMARLNGWVPVLRDGRLSGPPPFNTPDQDRALRIALIDGLIATALADAAMLEPARPSLPVLAAQDIVATWARFLKPGQPHEPSGARVAEWLRAHLPANPVAGLVHGDFSMTNMMFAHQPPARLVAILDWETASLGDPLLDLGWVAAAFADERLGEAGSAAAPSRQQVLQLYCDATGRAPADADFYLVLAGFRSGCLMQQQALQAITAGFPAKTSEAFVMLAGAAFERAWKLTELVS